MIKKSEQCGICIKYLYQDDDGTWRVKEDPTLILDIISEIKCIRDENMNNNSEIIYQDPEIRLRGKAIGSVLLKKMKELGLVWDKCVEQGYDGAITISSERIGVAAVVRDQAPSAF